MPVFDETGEPVRGKVFFRNKDGEFIELNNVSEIRTEFDNNDIGTTQDVIRVGPYDNLSISMYIPDKKFIKQIKKFSNSVRREWRRYCRQKERLRRSALKTQGIVTR